MKKVLATILKEAILMKRDAGGLLLLLLMPAILIVVMAMVQDAPFRDYQEMRFDLLLSDNDNGSLANEIKNDLKHSRNFNVIDSLNGKSLTDDSVKGLLQKGIYKIGIIIPKGITAEMVNSSNIIANGIAQKIGLNTTQQVRDRRDSIYIHMYFDPVTKPTFRTAIYSAIDKYVAYASSNILLQRLSALSKPETGGQDNDTNLQKVFKGISIKEEPLNNSKAEIKIMNSVQHNVPAWAIFGMFFIVVPIAGHIIKERQEGSALRIALIPNAYQPVAFGKILFYTLVCVLQFFIMMAVGVWLLPCLNLPALYLGLHPANLIMVAICIGLAATAYGYLVGTLFKTPTQAMPFGAISIVILSALGGIWVPVEILPPALQHIALLSPLHWSLDAVNQVILRDGDVKSIMKPCMLLLIFAILLGAFSLIINGRKYQSL